MGIRLMEKVVLGREEMETIRFNAPSHLIPNSRHVLPLSPNLPAANWLRRHVGALLRLTNVCYEDGCCCMSHYRPLGCLDRPILSQSQNICTGRPTRYLNKCSIIGTNCVGESFSATIWPEGMLGSLKILLWLLSSILNFYLFSTKIHSLQLGEVLLSAWQLERPSCVQRATCLHWLAWGTLRTGCGCQSSFWNSQRCWGMCIMSSSMLVLTSQKLSR